MATTHDDYLSTVPTGPATTRLTGWVVFGGVVLCVLGIVNVLHGITALEYDDLLLPSLVFENLTFWGWAFLGWGLLQIIAGSLALMGNENGPVVGMVLGSVSAIAWFFMIFAAPAAALVGITLSIAVVASLATAYGDI